MVAVVRGAASQPMACCSRLHTRMVMGTCATHVHTIALGRPAPPPAHEALIRLLLGKLTSLSFVKLVFLQTQEGRKTVHKVRVRVRGRGRVRVRVRVRVRARARRTPGSRRGQG